MPLKFPSYLFIWIKLSYPYFKDFSCYHSLSFSLQLPIHKGPPFRRSNHPCPFGSFGIGFILFYLLTVNK